jgi:CubicO group peptidase (beta-lactamase class C family)
MNANLSAAATDELSSIVDSIRRAGRVPGVGLAIVSEGELVFASGYGYRDVTEQLAVNADTVYFIGSTTKAFTAALVGILVDEGQVEWDAPVQRYIPWFRLHDACVSPQVTLRDLLTMRTGLPRHDFLWLENPISRAELVRCLGYLPLSARFRERFQYNNLTVIAAAHVAEVVTGSTWEQLVQRHLLDPLGMSKSGFWSQHADATLSYHENVRRELKATRRFCIDVSAPCGGTLQSTVVDMASWLLFNLTGSSRRDQLVAPRVLSEIHSPQISTGGDASAPTPQASYAMGWFVDSYNGHARLSHGGYIHGTNSEVTLFPAQQLGIVSFANFGAPGLARLVNQHTFDVLMGLTPAQTLAEKLAQYEQRIADTQARVARVTRVAGTSPSHPLQAYVGLYTHLGYGSFEIQHADQQLLFRRHQLTLPLEHWHFDCWIARDMEMFVIHSPHALDRATCFVFETDAGGEVAAVRVQLEPAVASSRFRKQ